MKKKLTEAFGCTEKLRRECTYKPPSTGAYENCSPQIHAVGQLFAVRGRTLCQESVQRGMGQDTGVQMSVFSDVMMVSLPPLYEM